MYKAAAHYQDAYGDKAHEMNGVHSISAICDHWSIYAIRNFFTISIAIFIECTFDSDFELRKKKHTNRSNFNYHSVNGM